MVVIPAEKSNIAWFKLAEFVMRKEKERALNIYRLLEHSLNDQAFAHQLEGDLLAAFNDEKAYEKYHTAAYLYEQRDHYLSALYIYEKLLSFSFNLSLLHKIIILSHKINLHSKTIHYTKLFITASCQQGTLQQAHELITSLCLDSTIKIELHELCIKGAIEADYNDFLLLSPHFTYINNEYTKRHEAAKVHALLTYIQEKNPSLYEACQSISLLQQL